MSNAPIQIRRYPNRRFYDRSRRQYVTLGDIEALVLEGRTVAVQDSRTGEDLTRQVLTQILMERHPDKMEFFPTTLLHGLLRANDLATEIWQAYLRQSMAALDGLQRSVTPLNTPLLGSPLQWLSALMPVPPAAPAPDELADRLATLEERIGRLEGTSAKGRAHEDLDGLERRVSGLEKRSDEAAPIQKARTPKRRS
jgi:polyhydroxyalkanoate synthesis repressor PhaR